MRRVDLTDLYHAACAVQGVAADARFRFCVELIWQAHVADKYVKRLRKIHPHWGDGSLRTAALASGAGPKIAIGSVEMLGCFAIVAEVLARRVYADQSGGLRERVCTFENCGKHGKQLSERSRQNGQPAKQDFIG